MTSSTMAVSDAIDAANEGAVEEGHGGTSALRTAAVHAFLAAAAKRRDEIALADEALKLKMVERFRAALQVVVSASAIAVVRRETKTADYIIVEDPFAIAVVDGLRFRLDDGSISDSFYVIRTCARCEQEMVTHLRNLADLGLALDHEAHDYDCTAPRPAHIPLSQRAEDAAAAVEAAGKVLAEALQDEQRMEDERPRAKQAAIRRLMQTVNDDTGKQHSASSAEKVVELDADYMTYRKLQSAGVVARQTAWAAYDAAKLRAQLLVNLAGAER